MKLWNKIGKNTAQALRPFMNAEFVKGVSTEDRGNSCLE